jgi:hypothetical protein
MTYSNSASHRYLPSTLLLDYFIIVPALNDIGQVRTVPVPENISFTKQHVEFVLFF